MSPGFDIKVLPWEAQIKRSALSGSGDIVVDGGLTERIVYCFPDYRVDARVVCLPRWARRFP